MDVNVRVAGEAGQGVQTTGELLVNAFAGMGLHVFSTQVYMSRVRGGLNSFDVRAADRELFSARRSADLVVALNGEARDALKADVAPGGVLLFDGKADPPVVGINFTETARQVSQSGLMANTVAAGAVFSVLGYDVETLCDYLAVEFKKKGPEVVEKNVNCARRGAELAREVAAPSVKAPVGGRPVGKVYSGSEAFALGAATAGLKFVAAYPMTPSTPTFTYLAALADEYGIVVEQAEDEISAVNMICGATYAGVPALATTSGGGFALMVEGLSLAGMLELPIVIMLAQRPAPATGLPTRTGQEDLKFAINAGHGDFARAVYAPGTIEEAYALMRRSFETAHKYQTPAIIMSDQFLADVRKNVMPLDAASRPIDRCILENPPADYMRYAVTESGVSPRAIPGGPAFVIVDSDEHMEDGHITEDLEARVRLQDKRLRKLAGMAAEAMPPAVYGPPDAAHLLVCWGSTYMPCREAVDILAARGDSVAMVHFPQVFPLNVKAAYAALSGPGAARRRVTCIEGNATAQFAMLLRQYGVVGDCEHLLKYNGLAFTGEEIVGRILR